MTSNDNNRSQSPAPTDEAAVADPIRDGARIVTNQRSNADSDAVTARIADDCAALETRLKQDIFASLCRIKPELSAHDFDTEIMSGTLMPTLPAPLQGVAIARVEGTLAFYNRVGWHAQFLREPIASCIDDGDALDTFKQRYHATHLHDLAYVHPRHFEKILGKPGAAQLWERLKRFKDSLS